MGRKPNKEKAEKKGPSKRRIVIYRETDPTSVQNRLRYERDVVQTFEDLITRLCSTGEPQCFHVNDGSLGDYEVVIKKVPRVR